MNMADTCNMTTMMIGDSNAVKSIRNHHQMYKKCVLTTKKSLVLIEFSRFIEIIWSGM